MSGVLSELAKAVGAKDLKTTLRHALSAYGKRKKVEMEHYGTKPEEMRQRWETMRDWCAVVLDVTRKHPSPEERLPALESLRETAFGTRFDQGNPMSEPVWPPAFGTKPHCDACNDHGFVWGKVYTEHAAAFGVRTCECGHGKRKEEVIRDMGKRKTKKERPNEF